MSSSIQNYLISCESCESKIMPIAVVKFKYRTRRVPQTISHSLLKKKSTRRIANLNNVLLYPFYCISFIFKEIAYYQSINSFYDSQIPVFYNLVLLGVDKTETNVTFRFAFVLKVYGVNLKLLYKMLFQTIQ